MVRAVDLNKAYKLRDDVVYRILDSEAIVLDVGRGEHFSLNRTATEVLKLIDDGQSSSGILKYQARKYSEDIKVLESDLVFFLGELSQKGILAD